MCGEVVLILRQYRSIQFLNKNTFDEKVDVAKYFESSFKSKGFKIYQEMRKVTNIRVLMQVKYVALAAHKNVEYLSYYYYSVLRAKY